MSERHELRPDEARAAREALRRALEGCEPDTDRLLDGVPRIMAEAAKRREPAVAEDWLMTTVPLARKVFPLLATATAALLLVSAGLWLNGESQATTDRTDLAALILSGAGEEGDDTLLQAIVGLESQDE